jgi:sensor histidine kinase YesM
MASIPALSPAATGTRSAAAVAAFVRVFNLKTVAVVFYVSALMLLGRFMIMLYNESAATLFFEYARMLRQTLISGFILLLGMAFVETLLAVRPLPRRPALALGILVSVLMAAIGIRVRLLVAGLPVESIVEEPSYFLSIFTLMASIGGIGNWLFSTLREEQAARDQLADAECCRETLQAQMVEARLSALQAQIEPHFLFNTLANVKRLYETAPHHGREMLSSLISYLRAALPTMRQSGSTLERELDLARSFLTILKMRMGDRLDFAIHAEAGLARAEVPPMVLPTLVENAIKHGLSPLPEGGRIDIAARAQDGDLVIDVRDNGAGFSGSGGSGVGLANTRSRLAALYGPRASLSMSAATPRGVIASVRMPFRTAEAA